MAAEPLRALAPRAQAARGLLLAALIVGAWGVLQAHAQFGHRWDATGLWTAPLLVLLICWLDVGLFIVAHDALHGSLVPGRPRVNRWVGRLCLLLYAGFLLDRFAPGHHLHHRHPGTGEDPDFDRDGGDGRFWPWYGRFMRRYVGAPEIAGVTLGMLAVAALSSWSNALVFWALPAALASLQLFAFGTWLPHRPGREPFADRHHARSNDYGGLASLLSCFHFGYHHEHHLRPELPWWRLPAFRRSARRAGAATAPRAGARRPHRRPARRRGRRP